MNSGHNVNQTHNPAESTTQPSTCLSSRPHTSEKALNLSGLIKSKIYQKTDYHSKDDKTISKPRGSLDYIQRPIPPLQPFFEALALNKLQNKNNLDTCTPSSISAVNSGNLCSLRLYPMIASPKNPYLLRRQPRRKKM